MQGCTAPGVTWTLPQSGNHATAPVLGRRACGVLTATLSCRVAASACAQRAAGRCGHRALRRPPGDRPAATPKLAACGQSAWQAAARDSLHAPPAAPPTRPRPPCTRAGRTGRGANSHPATRRERSGREAVDDGESPPPTLGLDARMEVSRSHEGARRVIAPSSQRLEPPTFPGRFKASPVRAQVFVPMSYERSDYLCRHAEPATRSTGTAASRTHCDHPSSFGMNGLLSSGPSERGKTSNISSAVQLSPRANARASITGWV